MKSQKQLRLYRTLPMHPRNPYREPTDFLALADEYPPLRSHLKPRPDGSSTINFKDDASQRRLTEALLHRDFGISLTLPSDRLCPPVPNRLNYVLWIQDMVSLSPPLGGNTVKGIDIGTGASVIYPLLACRLEPTWELTATEIDEDSIRIANINVHCNHLQNRIKILTTTQDDPILLPLAADPNATFDFVMCNPPFYGSVEEMVRSAEIKESGPSAVCTGAEVEMVVPGGETSFVCRMVRESLDYRTQCRWYTSMLGKMSSLSEVVALLRQHSLENYAITELLQGQTRRWVIGWSFGDIHPPDVIARISNPSLQNLMPHRNTLRKLLPCAKSSLQLANVLRFVLESIDGVKYETTTRDPSSFVLVRVKGNTWSRAARRKNKIRAIQGSPSESPVPGEQELKCSVTWTEKNLQSVQGHGQGEDEGLPFELEFQWVQGGERLAFESFYCHVSRKVEEELSHFSG